MISPRGHYRIGIAVQVVFAVINWLLVIFWPGVAVYLATAISWTLAPAVMLAAWHLSAVQAKREVSRLRARYPHPVKE